MAVHGVFNPDASRAPAIVDTANGRPRLQSAAHVCPTGRRTGRPSVVEGDTRNRGVAVLVLVTTPMELPGGDSPDPLPRQVRHARLHKRARPFVTPIGVVLRVIACAKNRHRFSSPP